MLKPLSFRGTSSLPVPLPGSTLDPFRCNWGLKRSQTPRARFIFELPQRQFQMVNSWGHNWDCFDAPSQILCNFVCRGDNKKHNVNIIYCLYSQNFQNQSRKNTNRGGGEGVVDSSWLRKKSKWSVHDHVVYSHVNMNNNY